MERVWPFTVNTSEPSIAVPPTMMDGGGPFGRTERLSLEKVNGGPVLGTPLAEAMLAAGFYSSPSGLRYRS